MFVQLTGFLQLYRQISATEFEAPVESNGEGEEGDNHQRLQIIAHRQSVAFYQITHHEVTVEADEQRHQWRIDALEAEIAADDITDTMVVGAGHADYIAQDDFRQETTEQAQCKYRQQMNVSLPLPHLKAEGLEDGYRQHHEDSADEARADGFFVTFVHTVGKGTK